MHAYYFYIFCNDYYYSEGVRLQIVIKKIAPNGIIKTFGETFFQPNFILSISLELIFA